MNSSPVRQFSLVLVAILTITALVVQSLPVPNYDRVPDPINGQSAAGYLPNGSSPQQPQPDNKPCPLGSCGGKGKWCELICRNNPNEGGKFCNCDTYALRSNRGPSFADCNRL